jgi:hypothetical protein
MAWPKILKSPLNKTETRSLAEEFFGDMIKVVADVGTGAIAAGCSLHADAEQLLLKHGAKQSDLWGANLFPGKKAGERIEFTSLINIRPRQGNKTQYISSPDIRKKVESIIVHYFDI